MLVITAFYMNLLMLLPIPTAELAERNLLIDRRKLPLFLPLFLTTEVVVVIVSSVVV